MAEAVVPRTSASVILVRDGGDELETFMVRRHARSRVAPSAYVFPGGTVREDDSAAFDGPTVATTSASHAHLLGQALSSRSDAPVADDAALAYFAAAVRELFEEAGVLLARSGTGSLLGVDEADVALQERLAAARLSLQTGELSLADLLAEHGLAAAFDLLVPFSHWVTPTALAARFDTRFFVAAMPERQEALHCTIETSEGIWITPHALLEGDYSVVYATAQHLRRITPYQTVGELLTFARSKPIRRVQPEVTDGAGGLSVALPPELDGRW
jgi:8-oxo-dGTP pyrophosphatase MutT (NUDIX family)